MMFSGSRFFRRPPWYEHNMVFFYFPVEIFQEAASSRGLPPEREYSTPETPLRAPSAGRRRSGVALVRAEPDPAHFRRGFGHEYGCRKPKPQLRAGGGAAAPRSFCDALMINAVFQPSSVLSITSLTMVRKTAQAHAGLLSPSRCRCGYDGWKSVLRRLTVSPPRVPRQGQ